MQFFFAYIDDGTIAFDPDVHNTKDERVYSFSFGHNEGEFATLALQVLNPRIGLLHDTRKQWIWASYQLDNSDDIVPFFKGRLVGLPENLQEATLTLVYRAEPANYAATKLALAQTLKVDPYWDEVWISSDQRDDPDTIIEANPVRYHIDPVTHAVTVSNINIGEDGTIVIDTDEQYKDTLRFGFGDPPLRRVDVKAVIGWDQKADGHVDLKSNLLRAFADAGSPKGLITSFTGQGLQASWPLPGDAMGGGWAFGLSQLGNPSIPSLSSSNNEAVARYLSRLHSSDYATAWRAATQVVLRLHEKLDERDGIIVHTLEGDAEAGFEQDDAAFYIWKFVPQSFNVSYLGNRKRTEQLAFSLVADVQDIITDVEAAFTISIQSQAISELGTDGEAPIGDARRSSYFDTERGKRSLRYLIALAARILLQRARTANLSLEVPFSLMEGISCRKNALIIDPRLPGGQAGGKIIGYGFTLGGGRIASKIVIGGSLGKGDALPALDEGEPTCAVAEAIGPDCQEFTGREIIAVPGQVKFTDYKADVIDDGVNFFHMKPETVIAGARSKNALAITSLPEDGDTLVIGDDTAPNVYTWRDEVDSIEREVFIGATTNDCVFNLGSALLATQSLRGVLFGSETEQNTLVTPTLSEQADVLNLYARSPGAAGNSIYAAVTGSYGQFRKDYFSGGADSPYGGLRVVNGVDVQRDVLNSLQPGDDADPYMFVDLGGFHSSDFTIYSTVEEAIAQLNNHPTKVKLELVPITNGPFNTDYGTIDVSELVIPNTIDLEAPSSP